MFTSRNKTQIYNDAEAKYCKITSIRSYSSLTWAEGMQGNWTHMAHGQITRGDSVCLCAGLSTKSCRVSTGPSVNTHRCVSSVP
ncbi:hypothetical protein H671_2g5587 [Cricetulus griseus]|uniref:Uncharacterized protein n=1 Tax=Cricetulus griseus TaxID=10029 RepID=A0A061IJ33_CRIGR|nr:hypothetical protein H671_2g5587 [Cricetulus griseus]